MGSRPQRGRMFIEKIFRNTPRPQRGRIIPSLGSGQSRIVDILCGRTAKASALGYKQQIPLGSNAFIKCCPGFGFSSPIFASLPVNPSAMLKNLLLLILILITPALLHAQILNMEKLRMEQDTAKNLLAKTTIGLTANNRSGAEDEPAHLFAFNLDVNLMYYPGKHAYILVSKFDYLKVNQEGLMNFGYLHARSNFLRERKFNYETFIQYSFDNARGLDNRWIYGGGLRHDIFKTDKTTFLIG